MKNLRNNYLGIIGILVIVILALLFYWGYNKDEVPTLSSPVSSIPADQVPADQDEASDAGYSQPQYSEDNPLPLSIDPFTANDVFEALKKVNKNKADFDFTFEGQEKIRTFRSENEHINFELKGKLLTAIDLENGVPLSIEFYTNDQISMARRKKSYGFDLPFAKETEKVENDDKILYSFDFNMTLKLTPGRYYFLVIPTGRNRVFYTGDFLVK